MSRFTARPELTPRREGDFSALLWFLLAAAVGAYFCAFALYPRLFFVVGVNHYEPWFIDTFALLASNDAVTQGLNPWLPNPLDYLHRPHVYSHWWLHLRDLGLTRADTRWVGLGIVAGFLLVALSRLRPRSIPQFLWYAAILASSPVVLGVDRANNDLVIFVLLAALIPTLRSTRAWVRFFLPPVIIALATGLKYYPAIAAALLLVCNAPHEARNRGWLMLALGLVTAVSVGPDLRMFAGLAPQPTGLLSFGAAAFFAELHWTGWIPKLLCVVGGGAAATFAWRRRLLGIWQPTPAQWFDWLYFLLGSLLLTGCFFASLNYGYRWIFAIWIAPLLWVLPRDAATPFEVRRFARWGGWLLLIALWWDPVCCLVLNQFIGVLSGPVIMRTASVCFLLEQPFTWALFLVLIVFLAHFARERLRFLGLVR